MAEAIAALYERDLEALGAAARERVLRQFTWHRAFHAQMATYASLVGTQRLPLPETEILSLRSPTS
jgi:alpha-1,6-mannosyltransferase